MIIPRSAAGSRVASGCRRMSDPACRHTANAVARSSTAEAYQGENDNGDICKICIRLHIEFPRMKFGGNFREDDLSEAQFPRRPLLGHSLNSLLENFPCSLKTVRPHLSRVKRPGTLLSNIHAEPGGTSTAGYASLHFSTLCS
jgi:hypothetical protein